MISKKQLKIFDKIKKLVKKKEELDERATDTQREIFILQEELKGLEK